MERCRMGRITVGLLALAGLMIPQFGFAADAPETKDISAIKREIKKLEQDRSRDMGEIKRLEQHLDRLDAENNQLKAANAQAVKQAKEANDSVKDVQAQVDAGPSTAQLSNVFGRYLGSHTFDITGAAGFDFIYDVQNGAPDGFHHQNQNAFLFDWEPMFLYRPADWILFEGVISTAFGSTGTGTDLSTADFQLELNDYLTVVGGLFDNPFGDWYESQSPMWVNRFITAPLPFGVEAVVPGTEVGIQLRGGLQWGQLGQDFDYTVWAGDGPSFSSGAYGATMSAPTPIAFKTTNGKALGGRLRVYPFPIDAGLGRLELGASSYDGKWDGSDWFTSWGVDFNYFKGNLQARGEWMESYRNMPNGMPADNRQGWYVQIGYFLNGYNVPFLPPEINKYLQRLEPLVRYSGVNQHAVDAMDMVGATGIGMGGFNTGFVPDFGLSGSPAMWAPHSREVAIGLDYWIAPSIVWQNELDIEMPQAGGLLVTTAGPTVPIGAIPNDRAFLTQFTIGF